MSSQVQQFDRVAFEQTTNAAAGAVLVDFYADWCAPCQVVGPTIDAIAEAYAGRLVVGKLNVDGNERLLERLDVQSIPTMLLFVGGKLVKRFVGVQSYETLREAIDEVIECVITLDRACNGSRRGAGFDHTN